MVAEGEYALDLEQQLRRSETLAVAGNSPRASHTRSVRR